jgi:hypothetical protein
MKVDLGGPGARCSMTTVRRLAAGELLGLERERCEAHVAGCERCRAAQEELAAEKAQLLLKLPFQAFAVGVAERLAEPAVRRPSLLVRWAPLAAAAAIAIVAGSVLVRRPAAEEGGVRSKGGASAQLFVQDGRGVRELGGERVAPAAKLLVSLTPSSRKFAAAVLLEPGEATVLYSGAARAGPLPQAFEWTGTSEATVLVVLADQPIDAARLHAPADAPAGADVVQVPLRR